MIQDLVVRDLESSLERNGVRCDIWQSGNSPGPELAASCHVIFPGEVEAWTRRDGASERIICLGGMLKLVLCDRREGAGSRGEVDEIFLGEYRYREVIVPAGVLRGWKAVGKGPALVLVALEGGDEEAVVLGQEEAGVPYDWDIVMR